jgi:hypothetical protein
MSPDTDLEGCKSNFNSVLKFDLSDRLLSWRYASDAEVSLYERLGRPYDTTTILATTSPCSEINLSSGQQIYEPKAGDWVRITKSERNWGGSEMDKFVGCIFKIKTFHPSGRAVFENMLSGMQNYWWYFSDGHFELCEPFPKMSMVERWGSKKQSFEKMEVLAGKPIKEPIKHTFKPIQFKVIKRIK